VSLSKATLDILEAQVSQGTRAADVLRAASAPCPTCSTSPPTIFHQREHQIADELVRWFRGGIEGNNLDPHVAVRYAAALSEVRALREEMEHRARKGTQAQETLIHPTAEDDADAESDY
jgi:hypothetical protein